MYRKSDHINFGERFIGLTIKSSSLLFKILSGHWVDIPPHVIFTRNASDINFEMVICYLKNFKKSSFDWKLKGLVLFLIFKCDWRATNFLLRLYFSQNHPIPSFNSNFVQRYWKVQKICFWGWQPTQSRQGKGNKLWRGSLNRYSEVLVPFLRFKVIRGWIPPHLVFSRNMS